MKLRHHIEITRHYLAGKGRDKVAVHLNGRAAAERGVIGTERDVLLVDVALPIRVENVLAKREQPHGQRNVARIAHIAAALVKRHDEANLDSDVSRDADNLQIRREVVLHWRRAFADSPPHVAQHPVDAGALPQRLQIRLQLRRIVQLPVLVLNQDNLELSR